MFRRFETGNHGRQPLGEDGMRRLNKEEWAKLKRAFVFGRSLGAISEATGVSRGTLSAYSYRHRWSRISGTEILRKQLERKNENDD